MIDLRSDTVTRPTEAMLKDMLSARVGDDVLGDDPTVKLLEERVADMFGKQGALFFPSGTMANQVAIKTHVQPGDEVMCDQTAHVYRYEGGGIAANCGASVRLLNGERGIFSAADVVQNINSDDPHFPKTRLLCVENTVNKGGGACWSESGLSEVCSAARGQGLKVHLDGARLWNAIVATKMNADYFGSQFDSISVCFSKGLGAPVGSVLTGDKDFIYQANRHRKRMGGGMRQSGYLAAACLHALDHHISRLQNDHNMAIALAQYLETCDWVLEVMPAETNILLFRVSDSETALRLIELWKSKGLLCLPTGGGWIRFVFHLGVSGLGAESVIAILAAT